MSNSLAMAVLVFFPASTSRMVLYLVSGVVVFLFGVDLVAMMNTVHNGPTAFSPIMHSLGT